MAKMSSQWQTSRLALGWLRTGCWSVSGALLVVAAYEVVLILASSHSELAAGQRPVGQTVAEAVAALALVLAFALAIGGAVRRAPTWASALFAPAGGAFVLAHYFTYDPYYFPTLRRYSDGGILPLWWLIVVVAGSILAGLLARHRPRSGSYTTSLILLVVFVTFIWMGTGH